MTQGHNLAQVKPEPPEQAAISGRVVAAETSKPLSRAFVRLAGGPGEISTVHREVSTVTDDDGRFEFLDLSPGRYWVRAERNHRLTTYYGQSSWSDAARSIVLQAGQRVTNIDVTLPRLGVIVGRVVDPRGEPVDLAHVSAMGADMRMTQTNDLGEFRIPRLLPGRYVVWVVPPVSLYGDRPVDETYAVTFVPGRQDMTLAEPLSVSFGETPVVEIGLLRAELRTVSGRVTTAAGTPGAEAQVTLNIEQAATTAAFNIMRDGVSAAADGRFHFPRVPEGTYRLRAKWGDEAGIMDLSVSSGPVEGVSLSTAPSASILGELVIDAAPGAECLSPTVAALPLDATKSEEQVPRTARIQPGGAFRLTGLYGRHVFEVRCAGGGLAEIRTLVVNGRELRNEPIDMAQLGTRATVRLVATPRATHVNGSVKDESGMPATGLALVVIDDANRWKPPSQYSWSVPVVRGEFRLQGLPPGRYFAFHEPPRRVGEITSPDYLRIKRAKAKSFAVPEAGAVEVTLICK